MMQQRALGVVIAGLVAACDDGTSPVIDAPIATIDAAIDAAIDAVPEPCNPITATGCDNGQKCTWITVQDTPTLQGAIGCVADGGVALGGACTPGPVGATTGYDDCVGGAICISGTCQDICGFDNGASAACAAGSSCTRYSGLFSNEPADPIAGACHLDCDPLTQMLTTIDDPCPTGQGCYTLTSTTTSIAVCVAAGTLTHGMPIVGEAFANSCAPVHAPRRPGPDATTWECGALCRAVNVTQTTNMTAEGGFFTHNCEGRGAAPPNDVSNGESCRHYGAREPFAALSPFSNTLGFCWKHAAYQYDSNGDTTPDAPFPRCNTLTTGDLVPPIGNPPHNDAAYFGCVADPAEKWFAAWVGRTDRIGTWR